MNLSQYQNSLPGKLSDSGQFIPDLNTNQFRFSIIGNLKRATPKLTPQLFLLLKIC